MAYKDFPEGLEGSKERKKFWLSPDGIELIGQWRREGVSLQEICTKYVGVSNRSFWRWIYECKELSDVCHTSQDIVNSQVERALLKRALGYDDYDTTEELVEGVLRVTKVNHKRVPPDVKACLAWLYSRRPERWRASQDPLDATAKDIETAKEVLVAIGNAVNQIGVDKVVENANADSTDDEAG